MNKYVVVLFFLISQTFYSQQFLEKTFQEYASMNKEYVAAHLNKGVFKTGETLWFTAYIKSYTSDIDAETSSNLQVGLYNDKGMLVDHSIHYIAGSVASGSLLLKYPPGIYFLKIQTNWMRNFPDSKPYVKAIEVIDYSKDRDITDLTQVNMLDTSKPNPSSGISMLVNALAPHDVIVSIQKTQEYPVEKRRFFLGVHNNKKLKIIPFEIKGKTKTIKIAKDQLSEGIQTLLLLDKEKKLLAERIIFISDRFSKKKVLSINLIKKENDSLQVALKHRIGNSAVSRASISILPLASKAVIDSSSLEVQEVFRNIQMTQDIALFLPTDRESLSNLNERLAFAKNTLDWETFLEEKNELLFDKERGFTIAGVVKNWNGTFGGKITFYQREEGQLEMTEIDKDGSFIFENNYLEKQEEIHFTVLRNNSSISKPEVQYSVSPQIMVDTLSNIFLIDLGSIKVDSINKRPVQEQRLNGATGIELNEVELTGKGKKEELTKNKYFAESASYESIKVTVELAKKNPTLSRMIRRMGYIPRINPTNGRLFILSSNPLDPPPAIIVDGFKEIGGLIDVPLTSIDEIYSESVGIYGGKSGVIYIYRKDGVPVGMEKEGVVSYPADHGFQKAQNYFNNQFSNLFDEKAKKYGAVFWKGDIALNGGDKKLISFPSYGLNGIRLIIQGLNARGEFFSQEEVLILDGG